MSVLGVKQNCTHAQILLWNWDCKILDVLNLNATITDQGFNVLCKNLRLKTTWAWHETIYTATYIALTKLAEDEALIFMVYLGIITSLYAYWSKFWCSTRLGPLFFFLCILGLLMNKMDKLTWLEWEWEWVSWVLYCMLRRNMAACQHTRLWCEQTGVAATAARIRESYSLKWITDGATRDTLQWKNMCSSDTDLLAVDLCPYYLPREFSQAIMIVVVPLTANASLAVDVINSMTMRIQTLHPSTFKATSWDFNHVTLTSTLPICMHFVESWTCCVLSLRKHTAP